MFSQIIKPHWFSLIWINLIIYNLVKLKIKDSDFLKRLIYISIFMGLSIGSALYNIFFIIVAYIFIFFFLNKNYLKINNVFISLFFLTFSFIITNPIFLTNSSGVILEFSNLINWFKGSINFKNILSFYKNSLITGFGFANIIFLIYLIFLKKNHKYFNLFFLILIIPLILISIITSQQSEWHINFRYLPYFLPSLLGRSASKASRLRKSTVLLSQSSFFKSNPTHLSECFAKPSINPPFPHPISRISLPSILILFLSRYGM